MKIELGDRLTTKLFEQQVFESFYNYNLPLNKACQYTNLVPRASFRFWKGHTVFPLKSGKKPWERGCS